MDVFHDDDERSLLGESLEEAPPRGERLVAAVAAKLCLAGEPEQAEQMRLHAGLVAGTGKRFFDNLADLRRDLCGRVLLEHAGLRLHDLAERPERDPVPIGEAATLAPRDELGVGVDEALQLVDEAALADAGDADEREELRRAFVARAFERIAHEVELTLASDELRARLVCDVDAEAGVSRDHFPDGDRLGFSLGFDSGRLAIVDGLAGGAVCRLIGEDSVDGRGALQARGGVDDVARGHALACLGARVEADERFAGRNGDPHLHVVFLDRPVADREAGADGALGIVLVRDGRTEQRHHGIPDELLHSARRGARALSEGARGRGRAAPRRPPGRAALRAA